MSKYINKFCYSVSLKIFSIPALFVLLKVAVLGSVLMGITDAYADDATDYLAGQKAMISKNFGDGSTLVYAAYMAEIISAIALYIKSKNLLVLVGLVVILIFTKAGFTLALAQ